MSETEDVAGLTRAPDFSAAELDAIVFFVTGAETATTSETGNTGCCCAAELVGSSETEDVAGLTRASDSSAAELDAIVFFVTGAENATTSETGSMDFWSSERSTGCCSAAELVASSETEDVTGLARVPDSSAAELDAIVFFVTVAETDTMSVTGTLCSFFVAGSKP
jgi:hypothetical protein